MQVGVGRMAAIVWRNAVSGGRSVEIADALGKKYNTLVLEECVLNRTFRGVYSPLGANNVKSSLYIPGNVKSLLYRENKYGGS